MLLQLRSFKIMFTTLTTCCFQISQNVGSLKIFKQKLACLDILEWIYGILIRYLISFDILLSATVGWCTEPWPL